MYRLPAAYLVVTFEALQNRLRLLEGIARGERAIPERPDLDPTPGQAPAEAMAEIVWADPSIQDLDTIAEYIALDKPEAARKLVATPQALIATPQSPGQCQPFD